MCAYIIKHFKLECNGEGLMQFGPAPASQGCI